MRITWRDGVTTVATAGAIALQQAYTNHWAWPLMSSTRWAIAGIAVLGILTFVFGYVFDTLASTDWLTVTVLTTLALVGIAVVALLLPAASYVTIAMFTTVAFWLASVGWHLLESDTWQTTQHA